MCPQNVESVSLSQQAREPGGLPVGRALDRPRDERATAGLRE
jgi:hypothetical protein